MQQYKYIQKSSSADYTVMGSNILSETIEWTSY